MFISPLERELGVHASHAIGRSHSVSDLVNYYHRIEAVNYALSHDDGLSKRDLADADIILVGVSRSGKTPTCLYLAMQFGIRAANYPLIPDDFSSMQLPGPAAAAPRPALRPHHQARAPAADPQRAPARAASTRRSRTASSKCARPRR